MNITFADEEIYLIRMILQQYSKQNPYLTIRSMLALDGEGTYLIPPRTWHAIKRASKQELNWRLMTNERTDVLRRILAKLNEHALPIAVEEALNQPAVKETV
jgi:hypothetical protein